MGKTKIEWSQMSWNPIKGCTRVSAGCQRCYAERIPALLETPAALRWVSYEPALGPVDFAHALPGTTGLGLDGLDWIVCGAESGSGARPMDLNLAVSARDQCSMAGIPFFMKQICERGRKLPFQSWPKDLQVREYPKL
jgi:protein gp37